MSVFELHNTKNCGGFAWRDKRTYLCTKYASNSVSGYLVWVCLKCTMAKKSWYFDAAPQTPIPRHQICQQQCFWMPSMSVFEMRNTKNCGVWPGAQAHTALRQICQQQRFWIPSVGVFEMHNAKNCGALTRHPKLVNFHSGQPTCEQDQ